MTHTRKRRILHVIASLDTGGTEFMALRLMSHWRSTFDQSVVVLRRGGGALEQQFDGLCSFRSVCAEDEAGGLRLMWTLARCVRREIRRWQPHAVIIHTFGLHQVVAAAAIRATKRTAVACIAGNTPPAGRFESWKWAAMLIASRLLQCPVAGPSRAVYDQLAELNVGMPQGSFVIPNGIDVSDVARRAQAVRGTRGNVQTGKFVIGMVARLDPIKDHTTLLRSFARLRSSHRAVALWIIGEGPLRPGLEALAGELGIAECVHFLGRRADVVELLAQMDAFALSTTEAEGFGIVLIEAMAAGVPVVASDVAACHEVLDGGKVGRLVRPADPEALSAEFENFITNPDFTREMADRASGHVRATYDIEICAQNWLRMLGIPGPGGAANTGCCERAVATPRVSLFP